MSESATVDAVEEAIDVIQDQVPDVIAHRVNVGIGFAVGFIAGGTVAWLTAKHYLRLRYEEIANYEIQQAREQYAVLHKTDVTPEDLVKTRGLSVPTPQEPVHPADTPEGRQDLEAMISKYQGKSVVPPQDTPSPEEPETPRPVGDLDPRPPVEAEVEARNVFAEQRAYSLTEVSVEDVSMRSGYAPYIISFTEYHEQLAEDPTWEQGHLVWYEKDGVLADEREQPVADTDMLVGDANLEKFGYASQDHNVVFVRNPLLDQDFEITRSFGSYADEVAGFIKHGAQSGTRRFRETDD